MSRERQQKPLEQIIIQYLEEIPDFIIIPHYQPYQRYDPDDPKSFLYEMLFDQNKTVTRKYKSTCKLKFECDTCARKGRHHTWTTSLGVCDICFRIEPIKLPEGQYDKKKMAEMNEQKRKKRQMRQIRHLIVQLLNDLEAELDDKLNAFEIKTKSGNLEELVKKLMEEYKIHIDFNYYFYRQKCKNCRTRGRVITYSFQDHRISDNFTNYVERLFHGRRLAKSRGSRYKLRDHLTKYCEACRLKECPYTGYSTSLADIGHEFNVENFFSEEEYLKLLLSKFKDQLGVLFDHIDIDDEESILQMQKYAYKRQPFCQLSELYIKKLEGKTGRFFFRLMVYYKLHYAHLSKQQRDRLQQQMRKLNERKQEIFEEIVTVYKEPEDEQDEQEGEEYEEYAGSSGEDDFSDYDREYSYGEQGERAGGERNRRYPAY